MSTFWLSVLVMIVGFSIPTQTGINATLGKYLGHPILASFMSFTVGALGLFVVLCLLNVGPPTLDKIQSAPWWAWTGGLFGAVFVTAAILVAPRLGATTALSLIVAGQMMSSLFFDHYGWIGFPQHAANWMRILGVGLVVTGVFLIQRF